MITQFPILVLANYRTGSSTLTWNLSKKYNLEYFSEPLRETNSEELMKRLSEKIENKENNFIIKFMPDQINDCELYQNIYNSDCYKIKLQRRDKVAQILSYYTSYVTGVWHSDYPDERGKNYKGKHYSIPTYYDDINFSIDLILDNDKRFDNIDIKFDQELYYEDIDFVNDWLIKMNPPVNYNGMYSYIKHIMEQKGLLV